MIEFEVRGIGGDVEYVRVLDIFTHHYTGELMRRVRIDCLKPFTTIAQTRFEILNEEEFQTLLERKKS